MDLPLRGRAGTRSVPFKGTPRTRRRCGSAIPSKALSFRKPFCPPRRCTGLRRPCGVLGPEGEGLEELGAGQRRDGDALLSAAPRRLALELSGGPDPYRYLAVTMSVFGLRSQRAVGVAWAAGRSSRWWPSDDVFGTHKQGWRRPPGTSEHSRRSTRRIGGASQLAWDPSSALTARGVRDRDGGRWHSRR
jgi:hypothetical protein